MAPTTRTVKQLVGTSPEGKKYYREVKVIIYNEGENPPTIDDLPPVNPRTGRDLGDSQPGLPGIENERTR